MTDNIKDYINGGADGNFFLLAGPCVIEGEEMALDIASRMKVITERLGIPYIFKGSYRKANRSRIDSFTGIGDEKALKILGKVRSEFDIPGLTYICQRKRRWRLNMSMCCRYRLSYAVRLIFLWLLLPQASL